MEKAGLIQRLMETFLVEFDERLHAMSRDLLALEAGEPGSPEYARRLQELKRNAHSLKGAARAVEIGSIQQVCHRFEDIMTAALGTQELLDAHCFELLFGALDGLAEAGKLLARGEIVGGTRLAGVLAQLEVLIQTWAQAARPSTDAPSSPHPTVPEPTAAPGAESASERPSAAQETLSVRVDIEKLDQLLTSNAELLGARERLLATAERLTELSEAMGELQAAWRVGTPRLQAIADQAPQRLQSLRTELDKVRRSFLDDWRLLDRAGAVLDERVRRIRMLPFSHGCIGLDRVVYDLAQGAGKDAELRVEGGEVAIDRSVLEELKDPLRHLIRNAVSHGIELPKERERAGKPARGCIRASAALRGGQVEIVVSDDGQGLPVEAIRRRAREIKLPEPTDDRALIEAVFIPGFSTAMDVGSAGAGRGIGLDAVRTQIKKMHGAVEVSFAPGKGTRVRLVVPLTLALLRVLLVKVGQQVFAISNHYVHKLLRVQRREVLRVGEHNMLLVDGQPVALQTLAHALSLPEPQVSDWQGKLPVVVLNSENRLAAFVVEELLAEQEVMVKGLGNRVQRLRNVAGAVLLADGRVALTLQVADLLHRHEQLSQSVAPMLQQLYADAATVKKKRCILVVDDSMTARSLARRILEAAGYLVELASDGVVGWERVQAGDIDLVLCDIDMPLMNGFQLTQTIRSSDRFRSLPVILITSTDNARSRERGAMAGANAYVTKGNFDQDMLLSLIEQLL